MLEQEYEQLVHYLRGMIADGVQLVHGGHLFDWDDTNISDLLNAIEQKKEEVNRLDCKVGDLLKNRYTGQKAVVISTYNDKVQMTPTENVIVFPKEQLWYHYEQSSPGE
jgi:hypothetical protein